MQHGLKTRGNPVRITVHLKAEPDTKELAIVALELTQHLDQAAQRSDHS